MSPPTAGKDSGLARLLGSGASGIAELAIFHPVDTVAKRLMTNKASGLPLTQIIFREHAGASIGRKFVSLFPGLGYAAGYKVLQRIYKFGGQPYFNDFLSNNYKSSFNSAFGEKNGKAMMSATAGSLTGIGEIVLLPLDVLKIMRQTNPDAFRSRGFIQIVRDEGFGLYRGASWTAARNAPGSFALFGSSAFTKEYLFGLEDYRLATWYQNFVASIAGSVSSIVISQPLDVIKTRIQNQNFESKNTGMWVVRDLIKNEGFAGFFKGVIPKTLIVGPKLIFSYTLAQTLIPYFGKLGRTRLNAALTLSNSKSFQEIVSLPGCFAVLALLTSTTLAALPTQASLAAYLQLNSTEPGVIPASSILGQTLSVFPFALSILSNNTHALLAFNVSKPLDQIGWLSVGFGSSMAQAGMVVLWPNETTLGGWTLSHRSSTGHSEPQVITSVFDTPNAFQVVHQFSVNTAAMVSVAFVRPLLVNENQTLFSSVQYLNMSRQDTGQRIVYAFSGDRPATDEVDAKIGKHDAGNFGTTSVDLTKAFVGDVVGDWTKYDTVVAIHAVVGAVTWLVLAPFAILIGRLGRAWGSWFHWHSRIQGFFVVPLTAAVVALGLLANYWGLSVTLTGHKIVGFVVLMLGIIQIGLGHWSHVKFNADRTSRPWYNTIHIVLGIVTLLLSWAQIALGFNDYTDRPIPKGIPIAIAVLAFVFLVPYFWSIALLVKKRHIEGRGWWSTLFGLGRDKAGVSKAWVSALRPWNRGTQLDERK